VFDYSTWFPVTDNFRDVSGDLGKIQPVVEECQKTFKNGEFMTGSFLENHDNPRFGSLTQDQSLVMNAMAWPFIHDGFPVLYYGQEQGYQGGNDPSNREALWSSAYATDKALVKHVTALNKARKLAIQAKSDYLTSAMTFVAQSNTKSSIVVQKSGLLALLTNVGANGTTTWKVDKSEFSEGTELVDVLSCSTVNTTANGALSVSSSKGYPQVLVPSSTLSPDTSVCPNVVRAAASSSSSSGGKNNGALGMSSGWTAVLSAASVIGFALSSL